MARIAVIGLGAMGTRMAANLIKAGHQLTVWNRTASSASTLVALGARQAATPKEAATGAEFVMTMVRDNEVSRQVWLDPVTGALAGMTAGAIAIESSTLTPDWVRSLGKTLKEKQIDLLEAPVSGSRPQAEAAQLVYLIGGDAAALKKAEPILKAMGSNIQHVGVLGSGALAKLATNTLLGIQVTVVAELIGMLEHAGADAKKVLEAVAATPVWSVVAGRAANSMLSKNFTPQFPVQLIEKDFGYTVQSAASPEAVPTIAAARSVFQKAIAQGLGDQNMTSVAQLFTNSGSK